MSLKPVLARVQRAGDAPLQGAVLEVHALHDAAVRHRTAARDAQRAADEHLADLDVELAREDGIVGDHLLARAVLLGEAVEDEVDLAAEVVGPGALDAAAEAAADDDPRRLPGLACSTATPAAQPPQSPPGAHEPPAGSRTGAVNRVVTPIGLAGGRR